MIGTTLNGRFSLEKELGSGGMGSVYRATDQVLQRQVAVKVLKEVGSDEVGAQLRLEAQILARLLHDNIVRLYDFGQHEGTFYFIMEEVDGSSFLKRRKTISLAQRVAILAQTADALDYAHRQGVIHRDVKPANLLLTASDQAKLSDFGLSLRADDANETGVAKGTPHYMSPEQAKGRRLDHRTDLYSLGVMLYECATGAPPFTGAAMSIMAQHVTALPEPPRSRVPEIGEELEQLILQLLQKEPGARPGSGREVADRLRELAAGGRLRREGAAPVATSSTNGATTPSGPSTSPQTAPTISAPVVVRATPRLSRPSGGPGGVLLDAIEAEPILLTPDERYLAGHYLAFLLGGSRRVGLFGRRPRDPLNADRARVLLAMTYLSTAEVTDETLARAAELIDKKAEVRPSLGPVVVTKYLASRDTPPKRKRFRQVRQQLQQLSTRAEGLTDSRGVLNPGLIPQAWDDLKKVAPEKTEVDDQLVERWNRVAEVWRDNAEFRKAVLKYATRGAWRDPASAALWPEVVYPLIERARWQRRMRSTPEAVWDFLCGNLHLPDAGNRLDRAIRVAVPEPVMEKLDVSLTAFIDEPDLEDDAAEVEEGPRVAIGSGLNPASFADLDDDRPARQLIRLATPEPVRQTLGELRLLWQEGIAALKNPKARHGQRAVPVGPYRLSVVASIRSRAAGQVVLQGLPNKQIEMLVPSFTAGGSNTRPVVAVWVYTNGGVVATYLDHLNVQRFILWDASTHQQTNFDDAADLNHILYTLGLEAPDGLDRVLSKGYRPRNPV